MYTYLRGFGPPKVTYEPQVKNLLHWSHYLIRDGICHTFGGTVYPKRLLKDSIFTHSILNIENQAFVS